jgi:hypothetical protein
MRGNRGSGMGFGGMGGPGMPPPPPPRGGGFFGPRRHRGCAGGCLTPILGIAAIAVIVAFFVVIVAFFV